ncbi:MAG TPA: hypothetical protein VL240_01310 [Candidatus Binatia bacterium]|nr:hypothetical protein [Candidatus Binatia bacterium]
MRLQELQAQLRAHIRARIRRGELTGSALAREAGFPQGHLSNFLNSRRGLSVESMDRLLESLDIGVLDLLDLEEIQRRAALPEASEDMERVAMVSPENAAVARPAPEQILGTRSFKRSFLRKLKPGGAEERHDWLRFVVIKMDARGARGLLPVALSAATLLIDRHYISLQPYRRFHPNIYVVSVHGRCSMGYVSVVGNCLVLRPRDPDQDLDLISIPRSRSYSEYIVGRVCHLGLEV